MLMLNCLILQQQYICIHQCLLCVLDGTEDEHIYDNVAPANVNIAFEGKEYFCLLVLSADNLCNQFETRSGSTKCRAWSGSNPFDTQMVFLKEFFQKVDFEKKSAEDKKAWTISRGQRIEGSLELFVFKQLNTVNSWYPNFCCHLLTFFKINFFKKFFQERFQSVKHFGSRSGPTLCRSWSGSKLFAKVISRL